MSKIVKDSYTESVQILKAGNILAYPTDTVYGVCVRFDSKDAMDKLRACKHRPMDKAFPIMVSDIQQMETIGIVSENTKKIIQAFMPGPITIILKKKEVIEPWMNDGKETIAVRMASDPTLEKIIREVGPIFMTSANISNEPVCTSAKEIEEKLDVQGIVDEKPGGGLASTIVDCTKDTIQILRQGPISWESIQSIISVK